MRDTELHTSWFERAGARLLVAERGRGRPVILLHGGLATHAACQYVAAPLASHHRVITPDLRGSGRSVDARPLDWDLLADDVAGLVRHLGLERAVIGGISFGAGCAVRVALRHPALVEALVLLTPAYGGAALGLTTAQQAAMAAMAEAGQLALIEGIGALRPLFAALPDEIRERACALSATYDPGSVAASTRFMASGAQPFADGAELSAITAPVLLVPGTDPTHPVEVADVYRRHLPRCTVRSIGPADYAAQLSALIELELDA